MVVRLVAVGKTVVTGAATLDAVLDLVAFVGTGGSTVGVGLLRVEVLVALPVVLDMFRSQRLWATVGC